VARNVFYTPKGEPPISAGEFIFSDKYPVNSTNQPYSFVPSTEAQQLIDLIRNTKNLNIDIRPTSPEESEAVGGYYTPFSPEGGHSDPDKRTIYLNPKTASLFTLAHEAGHALDPTLTKGNMSEMQGRINFGQIMSPYFGNPAEFLGQYLATQGPRSRLRSELEAQRYADDYYKSQGLEDSRSKQDLGVYPMDYIFKGVEAAERGFTSATIPASAYDKIYSGYYGSAKVGGPGGFYPVIRGDANTTVDVRDDYARRLMRLGLNKEYQNARQDQLKRAFELTEKTLGDATEAGKFIDKDPYLDIPASRYPLPISY